MSSESENGEHIRILLRKIFSDEFSFVIVQCNHSALIARVKQAIFTQYPSLAINEISFPFPPEKSIGILAEELGQGVIIIPNFEAIIKDENAWRLFNQTRDQISSFPITLIVFIPVAPSVIRFIMDNMRDFWSIRNLVVELWLEPNLEPVLLMNRLLEFGSFSNTSLSMLEKTIEKCKEYLELGLVTSLDSGERYSPFFVLLTLVQIYLYLEDYRSAIQYFEMIEYYESEQTPSISPSDKIGTGIAYSKQGELSKSADFFASWLEESLKLESIDWSKEELKILGLLLFTPEAIAIHRFSQEDSIVAKFGRVVENSKFRLQQRMVFLNLIAIYHLSKRNLPEAIEAFEFCLKNFPSTESLLARNMVVSNLAEAYLVAGDYYMAYKTASEAYEAIHTIGDAYLESIVLFQLGRIKVAQGLPDRGMPHLQEAINISTYLGSPKLSVMEKFMATLPA